MCSSPRARRNPTRYTMQSQTRMLPENHNNAQIKVFLVARPILCNHVLPRVSAGMTSRPNIFQVLIRYWRVHSKLPGPLCTRLTTHLDGFPRERSSLAATTAGAVVCKLLYFRCFWMARELFDVPRAAPFRLFWL